MPHCGSSVGHADGCDVGSDVGFGLRRGRFVGVGIGVSSGVGFGVGAFVAVGDAVGTGAAVRLGRTRVVPPVPGDVALGLGVSDARGVDGPRLSASCWSSARFSFTHVSIRPSFFSSHCAIPVSVALMQSPSWTERFTPVEDVTSDVPSKPTT